MFRKRNLASVAGLLAIAVLAGTASGASRANSVTLADAAGDSGNAPDLTSVTVANDDNGKITFSLAIPNRGQLEAADFLYVALETDGNLSNGMAGIDYAIALTGAGPVLLAPKSGSFAEAPAPSLSSSFSAGVLTISVNRSDLGNPTTLNFFAASSGDEAATTGDVAPNDGFWSFPIRLAPPPASPRTPATGPTSLVAGGAMTTVAKAGQPFAAMLIVKRADDGQRVNGKVTCRATIAGKSVRSLPSRSPGIGAAICTWLVPKGTSGKSIKGTITVVYKGASITRAFTKPIR